LEIIAIYTVEYTSSRLNQLSYYIAKAKAQVGEGNDVTLTGPGPVWLYLSVAHALHGIAKSLTYESPVTGPVIIFNHDPH
jgi:hypothetical protein